MKIKWLLLFVLVSCSFVWSVSGQIQQVSFWAPDGAVARAESMKLFPHNSMFADCALGTFSFSFPNKLGSYAGLVFYSPNGIMGDFWLNNVPSKIDRIVWDEESELFFITGYTIENRTRLGWVMGVSVSTKGKIQILWNQQLSFILPRVSADTPNVLAGRHDQFAPQDIFFTSSDKMTAVGSFLSSQFRGRFNPIAGAISWNSRGVVLWEKHFGPEEILGGEAWVWASGAYDSAGQLALFGTGTDDRAGCNPLSPCTLAFVKFKP